MPPREKAPPAAFDLEVPLQDESINLAALVSHNTATQGSASMESVSEIFKRQVVNFVAVLEGERLLGMCSRQETATLLGGALWFFALGAQANQGAPLRARNTYQSCDAYWRCAARRIRASGREFLR